MTRHGFDVPPAPPVEALVDDARLDDEATPAHLATLWRGAEALEARVRVLERELVEARALAVGALRLVADLAESQAGALSRERERLTDRVEGLAAEVER